LRHGATLLELVVAMIVAGIALGLVATISARQQRVVADINDRAALSAQIGDALSILPIDLGAVSTISGDLREARDTSLEIRATIATAVVCDTSGNRIVLAPPGDGASTYAGTLSPIEAGDTAWIMTPTDSAEEWRPVRVAVVGTAPAGDCAPRGPRLTGSARTAARVALSFDSAGANGRIGAPIRVTRHMRYSVYRASDAQWYLGQREWNNTTLRFNTIQPVSGPFLSPASFGPAFSYADSTGAPLPSPVADTKAVAMIRVDVRGQTRSATRALSVVGGRRVDSAGAWILLHNRR
jgi:hypothetical protein